MKDNVIIDQILFMVNVFYSSDFELIKHNQGPDYVWLIIISDIICSKTCSLNNPFLNCQTKPNELLK